MSATTCIGAQVASEAGEVLDMAGIFYVLFGWLPVALIAEDKGFGEVDLLVPKQDLTRAIEKLVEAGFHECQDPNCIELQENRRPITSNNVFQAMAFLIGNSIHAVANAHFHLGSQYESCTVLSLYTISDLLWWFEDKEQRLLLTDDDVWFSNDSRLPPYREGGPSGAWTALPPVRMLSPTAFSEALIRLMCQNYGHIKGVGRAWRKMWECLMRNAHHMDLDPRFQPVWDSFSASHYTGNPYEILRALRDEMVANNEFPYLPPVNLNGLT
ncbi:hypothetical protein ASPVEDRAFT_311869 [Aspergillus versicolor CBS 583.65]|uniref:Nucleotidyltransferase family protein n=1 Tax=Aspergillus versicolor CBS 583.65 TaxID=1036611 RepID=A0A1L9PX50_ASPVE|nr:uncharacterized protein ASPVEDRAFT_311869 [Aspergillus versicolor CBS 583.65]OJJ06098.1 hypothetical protein ASPVEDRAFT_311869 [Aspergillus versicolor CBS 583.65]